MEHYELERTPYGYNKSVIFDTFHARFGRSRGPSSNALNNNKLSNVRKPYDTLIKDSCEKYNVHVVVGSQGGGEW